jgi:hypothetical protein
MVPTKNTVDLDRRLPNSQLVVYPDAGHGAVFQFHEELRQAGARVPMRAPAPPPALARAGLSMPSAPRPTHWRPSSTCERPAITRRENGHEGIRREHYGNDGLRAADVPEPEVGDGDVLVKVSAAGINPLDKDGPQRRVQAGS